MRIGPFDVPITYIEEDFGHLGCYSIEQSAIKIKKGLPKHTSNETKVHEVLECIVNTNDIEIDHADLTTISMNIYQVLRDNGAVNTWK